MNKRILLGLGIIAASGIGLYLYFKKKVTGIDNFEMIKENLTNVNSSTGVGNSPVYFVRIADNLLTTFYPTNRFFIGDDKGVVIARGFYYNGGKILVGLNNFKIKGDNVKENLLKAFDNKTKFQ